MELDLTVEQDAEIVIPGLPCSARGTARQRVARTPSETLLSGYVTSTPFRS